jgi:hypothetical protein
MYLKHFEKHVNIRDNFEIQHQILYETQNFVANDQVNIAKSCMCFCHKKLIRLLQNYLTHANWKKAKKCQTKFNICLQHF